MPSNFLINSTLSIGIPTEQSESSVGIPMDKVELMRKFDREVSGRSSLKREASRILVFAYLLFGTAGFGGVSHSTANKGKRGDYFIHDGRLDVW
jgi:hypothetical protein